jgi:hypothetical protein
MSELSIKIAEPEINETDPWADDKLGRKACAEMLTSLLAGQTTALTVSVNGEWGSGKTFLLKRWQQQLTIEKYKAIYFNAWEDDFMGDPLVAIVGQLRQYLEEDPNFKGILAGAGEAVLNLASGVLKKATGMDVIAATSAAQEAAASKRDNILDDYDNLCKSRTELKNSLKKMAKQIFDQTEGKPLVFIVDELDRCRPTFAIETLERIKHLFDIDHVVFVLGIDRKQLGESIKSVYGNIDIENYLHRFIDLDFQLPQTQTTHFIDIMWQRYNIEQHVQDKEVASNIKLAVGESITFKNCFSELLLLHKFTFREIESALRVYAMVLRSTKSENFTFPYFLVLFILLKFKKPDLLQNFMHEKCTVTEIADFVIPNASYKNKKSLRILKVAIYCLFDDDLLPTDKDEDIRDLFKGISENKSIANHPSAAKYLKEAEPHELSDFVQIFDHLTRHSRGQDARYGRRVLPFIVPKMDLILTGVQIK